MYLASIYELPGFEREALRNGLNSLKNLLDLELMETNTEEVRELYELCKTKHELVKFLHTSYESDTLENYALKDKLADILNVKH